MEEVSVENAKISDSGYSNTCSNSQSQRSSGSSISRNSNRSESSGYCDRRPSTFGSSNEALPQPISKRKDKEHKKKKSKAVSALNTADAEVGLKTVNALPEAASYNNVAPANVTLDKKPEVATEIELVDATDPGEHNGDTVADPEAGLASRTIPLDDSTSQANEGFCAVISMHDGLVLYTTPSISNALGYLKDAWIDRSFIDYVHPKDKTILADQIASIASQEERSKGINGRRASLFCGLRKFTKCNVPNGYCARSNLYLPFHLTLSFRDFRNRTAEQQPSNRTMFLVVTAQPVHSAYKAPEETIISSVFTTRHTATCYLSHVDPDVVQYFGYLPQDMIGRSLFDFYHPEDLPFIKDIYETVIRLEGFSFRSKPYRFAVQNGDYVILETEWSSFINPWTKKLEFVVGQHRVLKGPMDPDIFRVPRDNERSYLASISEEVLKEAKIIQSEIRALLDESVQRTSDINELDVSKRCKDLASFMESLLQETKTPGVGKDGPLAMDELRSFSGSRNPLLQEHDSVMFGEISPHHEYYDSKSSTETPPSYNQLNYNENIERFFKSKPLVATMYGSDEENVNSSNDEGARKCMSPINGSGASGSGSAENLSSGSNNQMSSASRGDAPSNTASNSNTTATESFKLPTLTESLLNRHNEDMEKLMMQKHRELRSSIKNSDKLKDPRIKTDKVNGTNQNAHYVNQGHGIKRSGSRSWEDDSFKISKHDKISRTSTAGPANVTTTVASMSVDQSTVVQTGANINLWPPLASVTVPSSTPSQPCVPSQSTNSGVPRFPLFPSMIPIYYVPVPQPNESATMISPSQEKLSSSTQPTPPNPYMSYVATAMAGMIYPTIIGAPPPRAMMYQPFLIPEQASAVNATARENQQLSNDKCPDHKRPASQATSIKAEPGSIMAMSESSKKVLSPDELFSSCVSNDGGCSSVIDLLTPVIKKEHRRPNDYNGDESSSSSFYSSFLYKSSDSSNPDQKTCEVSSEDHTKCQQGMRRKDPPWLEDVHLTPELIYEYQMDSKTLSEVLKADMNAMKKFNQPLLVNDQLAQLYLDLEMEGFGTELVLEDGITSSGSDSGSSNGSWTESQRKQKRRMVKYGKLVMIHDENAPLPPPLPSQTPVPCRHS
ncbi:period circadian protein isoform X2 [Pseudomyrmex gracilis]|uniref:period circadian protein isoform X2 n=1 Tax=Pseudomyrmex gracilis TaxID=219809 RepID=UPI000995851C|nr:period circadian protein isoform X2 [Pseudomyrmex gracilis]